MIPVQLQPEPADFSQRVRDKGAAFLNKVPHPKNKDWINREYWQESLDDLYEAYGHICTYSAQWIPRTEGSPTVDHFIPKSVEPKLAYEWQNFRLACLKLNTRKGTHQDVIDPFWMPTGCFILEFPSLQIKPAPILKDPLKQRVIDTIKHLKLNEDAKCVKGRQDWLIPYCQKVYPFDYLKRRAPFIAYELERQALVDKIASIMGVR
ncbi:hypothetical protein [Coleofasciculus sp. FACHB-129]|uniref:hypothetical protein n=1 Tax=Cyanophyceae TaxID=3028117 RepID=UPI001686498F|nr:hypothetical protein [Coleofasciculus sp. FACHB-129]MBD1894153.1 hypothetical protein [Coleofasciculus sp. FACHB-129]